MMKVAVPAAVFVVALQAALLALPDRAVGLTVGAGAAALALLGVRWAMTRTDVPLRDDSTARDPAESLCRWLARTETLVARADTTRADWDKHLRPMLARQFELATGQRKAKDARAFHATAHMVFGAELWQWVDPDNVSRLGHREPGPGRAVLDAALQRLERL